MELTAKQTQAFDILEDATTNELIFGGGAGGAKSYLGCFWIFSSACLYPGTRWVIARNELKVLKETTLNTLYELFSNEGFDSSNYTFNEVKGLFEFYNGSEIILKELIDKPSDRNFDRLGSLEITGAFVDECNQITEKAWKILKSRIRYKLDENRLIPKILGTCNPAKNWVYSEFYKKAADKKLDSNKRFIQSLLGDNPHISKTYKQNLLDLDEASKQRLLYGNWDYDDDPTKLCETAKIYEIWENDFLKTTSFPKDRYLTADIALNGSDLFVVGVWDNFTLIHIETMEKSNGKEVEEQLKKLKLQYSVPNSNIIFDADGIGNFFKGIIKGTIGFTANPSKKALNGESKKYRCLNDQCIFYLCDYVNKNQIHIRPQMQIYKDKISEELGILRNHSYDQDARLAVTPKKVIMENIKRSPDFLDMMKMRMYFELLPKAKGVR